MKKQQIFLLAGATLLFCVIYFFGKTTPSKKTASAATAADSAYNIQKVLEASKSQLTVDQRSRLAQLENSVVRGNVREQKAEVFKQLTADFDITYTTALFSSANNQAVSNLYKNTLLPQQFLPVNGQPPEFTA